MVKELEDRAYDGVVVILDCDPPCAVGTPPDSSFDVAVRAAGSILQAHATRGRSATFVSTGRERAVVPVRSAAGDLGGAVTALAAAEPDALYGLARFLGSDHAAVAGGGEVVVVTATREPAAFAAVLALAGRRVVSVVWVDAASFAGAADARRTGNPAAGRARDPGRRPASWRRPRRRALRAAVGGGAPCVGRQLQRCSRPSRSPARG